MTPELTSQMAALRARDYSRLDADHHVYLDYTGSGLYAAAQIDAHSDMLKQGVFGNPHSQNPTSLAATHKVEATRERIRAFFNAPESEYEIVFTLNASGALKLLGESYPFEPDSRYVLTADNHNSVNGIREFVTAKGAEVRYVPLGDNLRIIDDVLFDHFAETDTTKPNLFAYPAQSNFSGVKYPLEWIDQAQQAGYDVLLDAAAYVPTNRLDLSAIHPDFVCVSFYKMFGFPTGIGALIMRRETMHKLNRPWFGGGTVRFASTQNQVHLLHLTGEAFEDGTVNFLEIPAVINGLDFLDSVNMDHINAHVAGLTEQLLDKLVQLKHSNGNPVVRIYGPTDNTARGGTIAMNVIAPDGTEVDHTVVEQRANTQNISLRTGCFCNPGASEAAFRYSAIEAYQCFYELSPEGFTLQQFSACMDGMPVGAVRVSLGIASNNADIQRLMALLNSFVDCDPTPMSGRSVPDVVSD